MAINHKWQWVRGIHETIKLNIGATGMAISGSPVEVVSNLAYSPITGATGVIGVCETKPAGSAKGVSVVVSEDVYRVSVATGVSVGLMDAVSVIDTGEVKAQAGAEGTVGHVVDYTPVTGPSFAHVKLYNKPLI